MLEVNIGKYNIIKKSIILTNTLPLFDDSSIIKSKLKLTDKVDCQKIENFNSISSKARLKKEDIQKSIENINKLENKNFENYSSEISKLQNIFQNESQAFIKENEQFSKIINNFNFDENEKKTIIREINTSTFSNSPNSLIMEFIAKNKKDFIAKLN